ncbi:MAG: hypothetical protein ABL872_08540 [Lacibacter sp.]
MNTNKAFLVEKWKETVEAFDFVNKYFSFDQEYAQRDFKTFEHEKLKNGEIKKMYKQHFSKYDIYYEHGGFYFRKQFDELYVMFNFQLKSNFFLDYIHIYINNFSAENIISDPYYLPARTIRILLDDDNYPMQAKKFKDLAELEHITRNELAFYESLVNQFFENCELEYKL